MKKAALCIIIVAIVFAVLSASIFAAAEANVQPTIELKFHKDFGYSSFGNDAQGNWTAQATASADTMRVEFYLNNSLQHTDTEAPFKWSYYTDNYPVGLYTIKAVAYNAEGNSATAEAQQNFVPYPEGFTTITIAIAAISIAAVTIIAVIKIKRTNRKTTKS